MNWRKIDPNYLFIGGLCFIFLFSLAFRFWGLDRFNYLVFDEDHYVPHAYGYLTNQANFVQDIHPPFGRYLVAVSMWLDAHNPLTNHDKTLPDTLFPTPESFRQVFRKASLVNPFSFRWLTAFCGALIPLAIAGIAHQLTNRKSLAFIAGVLAMLDGYLIIESRFALINIFLVLFGLIGCYGALAGVNSAANWSNFWLAIAGIFFGCGIAVKWSGVWFLLGLFSMIALVWLLLFIKGMPDGNVARIRCLWFGYSPHQANPVSNLAKLGIVKLVVYFAIIPTVTYSLLWIPHLPLNEGMSFIDRHKWILESHLVSSPDGHPNCSRWYQWFFATAPVGYYLRHYEIATPQETITIMQGYGNPVVWWLSTIVMAGITFFIAYKLIAIFINIDKFKFATPQTWAIAYLVINFWANILPWIFVRRCTFQYHYLPAYGFAIIALAWLTDLLLSSRQTVYRTIALLMILSAVLAFQFWLPIYLGLPMTAPDYEKRLWLRSWHEGWVFTGDRPPLN